jgi:DMSO/TMAO reductase YedYZ molybdopterin-dependent catalytic subunit
VDDDIEAELPGDLDGVVVGHVVDQDDPIDDGVGDVCVGSLERPGRVVRGHDDDNARPFRGIGGRARDLIGLDLGIHRAQRTPAMPSPRLVGHIGVMDRVGRYGASASRTSVFERLFGNGPQDPAVAERIPPGQYKTDKFPVLHYGSVPHTDLPTWDFRVWGEVDSTFTLTWDQFKGLPRKTVNTDIHCVTRWSKLDTTWEGVPIQTILEMAGVRSSATHVVSHAEQGYTANLPLSVLDDDDVLLADTFGGEPLELEHGYPLRLLVPKRYFWKSSKWIRGLEFLDHDQLGFWERYGYNNDADPWKEERFSE